MTHHKSWTKWIEWEKFVGFGDRKNQQKKGLAPPHSTLHLFVGCTVPYNKNDPHQIQFEEDLVLFIVNELIGQNVTTLFATTCDC